MERPQALTSQFDRAKGWWKGRNAKTVVGATVAMAQVGRVESIGGSVREVSPEVVRRLNRDSGLVGSNDAVGTISQDAEFLMWRPWGAYKDAGVRAFRIPNAKVVKADHVRTDSVTGTRHLRIELDDHAVFHIGMLEIPQAQADALGAPASAPAAPIQVRTAADMAPPVN